MIDRNHDELPGALRDATNLLRESPAANDVWRRRLLRAIENEPRPRPGAATSRTWSVRPIVAIAAGLVCAIIGGATTAVVLRTSVAQPDPRIAAASQPEQVRFSIVAPSAAHVSIVGDFNGWNPTALPLERSADGRTWEVVIPLRPGRYAYAFVVDGELASDPAAPRVRDDDFGSVNSVVMVKGS